MSIVWVESFDLYASAAQLQRRYNYTSSAPSLVAGRFAGSLGMEVDQNGSALGLVLPAAQGALTIGFALYISGCANFSATGTNLIEFKNGGAGGTTICKLGLDSAGSLRFGRGDFTTNLIMQSANGLFSANGVWHYCELVLTRDAAAGAATLYVDGVSVATVSGANTGASNIDALVIASAGAFSTTRIFDDLYITDTAVRVGECRIDTLRPSADTAQKDWTPSTGTANYAMVDDATFNDDTDYVSASTVGNKDLYDCGDLAFTPASILAVQVTACARKDDVATRTMRTNLKSGATTHNGTTKALATTYQVFNEILETDPNTSAAWTPAGVNAAQIGPEVVA